MELTSHYGDLHAAVLDAPLMESGLTDAQISEEVEKCQVSIYPFAGIDDLTVSKF